MIMSMCKIICITNRSLVKGEFYAQLEKVAKAKIDAMILREKDLPEAEYEKLAREVRVLCEKQEIPLILHTYAEIAKRTGIKKIHLPYQSLLSMTEKNKGEFDEIGASIHAIEEAVEAERSGATYLTAGHIFATDCKPGLEPRGLEFLQKVCHAVKIPVYAIGGITPQNAALCCRAGAAGVCMMSSLMQEEEPDRYLEKTWEI